ncbi:MAG: hypothetical protein R3F30_06700 [Planctomycetota bacterium]
MPSLSLSLMLAALLPLAAQEQGGPRGDEPQERAPAPVGQDRPASRPASRPVVPPAVGPKAALELAAKARDFAGGKAGWAKVKSIVFTINGRHRLLWDKVGGRVRIEPCGAAASEDPDEARQKVLYYEEKADKGWIGDKQDDVATRMARSIWINDIYWLLFPLMALDNGVRLDFAGLEEGGTGDEKPGPDEKRLVVTFDEKAVRHGAEYVLWIDEKTGRIRRWDYVAKPGADALSFWFDRYTKVGPLTLSLERPILGTKEVLQFTDVAVDVEVDEAVWRSGDLVLGAIGVKR